MNNFIRLLLAVVVLVGAVLAGLLYLGQATTPPAQTIEKVLSDDQFPR